MVLVISLIWRCDRGDLQPGAIDLGVVTTQDVSYELLHLTFLILVFGNRLYLDVALQQRRRNLSSVRSH
jgi:hypothetical protein